MMTDQELDRKLLVLRIIWLAMLGSLGVYLVVALLVAPGLEPTADVRFLATLRAVLYAVAAVVLVATRFIRRLILTAKGQAGPSSAPAGHPAVQRYSTAMIVSLAMSESIGIDGLVLFLLGKSAMDLYLLMAVSALAMSLYRPRKEDLVALVHENPSGFASTGWRG